MNTSVGALAELLARCPHVLLDFDGPICAVFGGTTDRAIADQLRANLPGLPDHVVASSDPFDVLRHAATLGPEILDEVAHEFTRLEVQAVATATPTPGATEAIAKLCAAGHTITIVSNNSTVAVETYLRGHDLAAFVGGVSARTSSDPDLLKPNPYLVDRAIRVTGATPSGCVLLGDSPTDIIAGHAAGTAVVAYANKPGKYDRLSVLGPDIIIDTMFALTRAICAVVRPPCQA